MAQQYGMNKNQAGEFAHALVIAISSHYGGGEKIYISRSPYIEARQATIYSHYCAAKRSGHTSEEAAVIVGAETGFHVSSVFRIIKKLKNRLHPKMLDCG